MAIIDRVKFDGLRNRDWLIYKHPVENLVFGTQLIVGEGQAAIFVKSGQVCDLFTAGTYTLDAANLPILQGLINIPFGGKTPFTAEIFYINTVSKLDMRWGTPDPIQLIDPKYFIKLRIRAFGQMGLKIKDYTLFLRQLIGVLNASEVVRYDKVMDYFKGLLVQKMKTIIADIIINQKISALEISAKLEGISEEARERITPEFNKFGISVVNFFVKSINFPDEDFQQINDILRDKAQFEIMGDNRYVTKRSFDVYDSAASNESGVAGAFVAGGVGLGAGAALGTSMGNTLNTNAAKDNSKIPCPACNAENIINSKFCYECGKAMKVLSKNCPKCNTSVSNNMKFCPECGSSMQDILCECGAKLLADSKFCHECGRKVE
ncbi:MAG TPA: virion core protein (lumpy skin disease virus) [Clostridiales bacterium]|nr:SPFH domain-containing protein [Clostridia bacterium]HCS72899.1 virion core protein (lumpy skin disease virus) [Clostridiales bacterium]